MVSQPFVYSEESLPSHPSLQDKQQTAWLRQEVHGLGHVPRETELEFPHHAPHPPFTAEPWSMPTPSLHHPKCSTQTATIKKNLSMSVNSFIQFSQIVPFQRLSLQQICTEWLRYHTGKHRARHRRFSGGHDMVRFLLALTRLLAGNNEQVMKSVIATTQGG